MTRQSSSSRQRELFFNAVLRGWPKARKNDGANCSDATPFFLLFDSRRAADRHRVAEFEPLFKVVGTSPERERKASENYTTSPSTSFRYLHVESKKPRSSEECSSGEASTGVLDLHTRRGRQIKATTDVREKEPCMKGALFFAFSFSCIDTGG